MAIESAVSTRTSVGTEESADRRVLDLARLELLPEPFRGSPDHQARDEHRDHDVEEHPVEARADPAEDHLAEE